VGVSMRLQISIAYAASNLLIIELDISWTNIVLDILELFVGSKRNIARLKLTI
jgi:hypothetical protein